MVLDQALLEKKTNSPQSTSQSKTGLSLEEKAKTSCFEKKGKTEELG